MRAPTVLGMTTHPAHIAVLAAAALVLSACTAPPAATLTDRPSTTRVVVERVVDGDTVVLTTGERVRVIGIDTPEQGTCGFDEASAAMVLLVEGREVDLVNPGSVQDTDGFDRLLRYLDADGTDAGLALIEAGLAIARYDSRDGYDRQPREDAYRAADRATPDRCR